MGIAIDTDDIGGVVRSADGPEAGVWVIAETDTFDTRYAKIVVTDDQGRYVVPDLADAEYDVWVRGYGLTDSAKVTARPGAQLDLAAVAAPSPAVAAEVYPAIYWYAMMHMPPATETTGIDGGLNRYMDMMRNNGCVGCHQLGQKATRTIPEMFKDMPSEQAWIRRVQSGQAGEQMIRQLAAQLAGVPFKYFADWTDRIAAGEVPAQTPPRPQGLERNIVATVRDWATPKAYLHDLTTTDRRNPTVNGYGKIYGSPELSTDHFPILDPLANTDTSFHARPRDADTPSTHEDPVVQPSPYWGDERIWDSQSNSHNPMIDHRGRVWYTARVRAPSNQPAFCREGSDHPSAQVFPTTRNAGRHLALYEPSTGKYTTIDTCFGTHHLHFDQDANNTLWTSGGGNVVGWLNTKKFDETGDAAASQGWAPIVIDANGNGKLDAWVEADEPLDPTKDRRIDEGYYAAMPSPVDGSVWGTLRTHPGAIVRLDPGPNPPQTALSEIYNVPLPGYGPRGADIDLDGVVWVSLGSGHLGEFDRRKCEGPLNGPEAALGDHCPEGWTFHSYPGPGFVGQPSSDGSAESSYYSWVDQHNVTGLGDNVPMSTANLFDGVHALVDDEWVTLRIPYPLGFYAKGFEGRIDDPNAGWKGRGLWVPSGDRTPWLKEGGQGTRPLVVHFQTRPDPLAH
jgi:hypothetical protein